MHLFVFIAVSSLVVLGQARPGHIMTSSLENMDNPTSVELNEDIHKSGPLVPTTEDTRTSSMSDETTNDSKLEDETDDSTEPPSSTISKALENMTKRVDTLRNMIIDMQSTYTNEGIAGLTQRFNELLPNNKNSPSTFANSSGNMNNPTDMETQENVEGSIPIAGETTKMSTVRDETTNDSELEDESENETDLSTESNISKVLQNVAKRVDAMRNMVIDMQSTYTNEGIVGLTQRFNELLPNNKDSPSITATTQKVTQE